MGSVKTLRVMRGLLIVAVVAGASVACGDDADDDGGGGSGGDTAGTSGKGGAGGKSGSGGSKAGSGGSKAGAGGSGSDDDAGAKVSAADLRVTLNLLLGEHISLAAKATGAALGERTEEFQAYGDLLNENGTQVGELVGAAFGAEAETKFNSIWSAHNGYFVAYTEGVAADDEAKKNQAVKDLTEKYVPEFAKLLAPATGLTEKAISDLTAEHVTTTAAIVDAQAEGKWEDAYKNYRDAFKHMAMIGDALSEGIAKKLPTAFEGDSKTAAVSLRVALNQALQEHVYLATFATGAALGGRTSEFDAAGAALNQNGTDLGDAIGGIFGDSAKTDFNRVWSAHNGYFVDYTTGVAEKNEGKKTQAVKDLTEKYVPEFAALLNSVTDIPVDTLKGLTSEHVVLTKTVVDAQGADKAADAAKADVAAAQHMLHIGDPVAAGIVAKAPDKF